MQIIPKGIGVGLRPRLACEVRPESIVAARADDTTGILSAVSRSMLPHGVYVPGLRPGNIVDRPAFIAALQRALDPLAGRTKDVSLIIPDSAVRVLLLEFDALPSKAAEALPIVRFRLKKLLPFEADDAAISYQIMSSSKSLVRIIAAALPKALLDEYELAVRDAGYEPGAILPSTLASLALLAHTEENSALIVNANQHAITTAIVRDGILLLHRTQDFTVEVPALAEIRSEENAEPTAPAPLFAENLDPAPPDATAYVEPAPMWELAHAEDGAATNPPHDNDTSGGSAIAASASMQADVLRREIEPEVLAESIPTPAPVADMASIAADVAQALSVAAAYFEDTLHVTPTQILCTGTIGAETLYSISSEFGFGDGTIRVRELLPTTQMLAEAATAAVPRGLLAGVAGALSTGDVKS